MLSQSYQNIIRNIPNVAYKRIDFNQVCDGQNYENLEHFIELLSQQINEFGYYSEDLTNQTPQSLQSGAFRINCVDCLDRTNTFMSKMVLRTIKILFEKIFQSAEFINKFKICWRDVGDQLSQLYSGTDSTLHQPNQDEALSHIKEKVNSGIRNVHRYYKYQFEDKKKQEAIQFLQTYEENDDFNKYLLINEKKFSQYYSLSLAIITYNVGGRMPKNTSRDNFLLQFFQIASDGIPDIIAIGLQEIVDLNPQNIVISSNNEQCNYWDDLINQSLKSIDSYIQVQSVSLVGLYLTVFIRSSLSQKVRSIQFDQVKTGLKGTLGNKGGVLISLFIDDTSIALQNCHLCAGEKDVSERQRDLKDIQVKSTIYNVAKPHDFSFLFGDLNFRIDLPYSQAISLIQSYQLSVLDKNYFAAQNYLNQLVIQDQLNKIKSSNEIIKYYNEGELYFLPTYKYDDQSDQYDTSSKRRTPSWCDRVLYTARSLKQMKQTQYGRIECKQSDHRPVYASFILNIRKVDKELYNQVASQFQPVNMLFITINIQNYGYMLSQSLHPLPNHYTQFHEYKTVGFQ